MFLCFQNYILLFYAIFRNSRELAKWSFSQLYIGSHSSQRALETTNGILVGSLECLFWIQR